ncbi:hypothetical protein [Mycoplasma bradburyae]|nr:hypothetical protein [Mycoplasma bradburyae]
MYISPFEFNQNPLFLEEEEEEEEEEEASISFEVILPVLDG